MLMFRVDEDVMKKMKIFIEPTTNVLQGLQDSINKTPQNVHISFTPDYDQYACLKEPTEYTCVSGLVMNIYESLLIFLWKLEGYR